MEGKTLWRYPKKMAIYNSRREASEEVNLLSLDLQTLKLENKFVFCMLLGLGCVIVHWRCLCDPHAKKQIRSAHGGSHRARNEQVMRVKVNHRVNRNRGGQWPQTLNQKGSHQDWHWLIQGTDSWFKKTAGTQGKKCQHKGKSCGLRGTVGKVSFNLLPLTCTSDSSPYLTLKCFLLPYPLCSWDTWAQPHIQSRPGPSPIRSWKNVFL